MAQLVQQTTESFHKYQLVDTSGGIDGDDPNHNTTISIQRLEQQLISLGTNETATSLFLQQQQEEKVEEELERSTKRRKLVSTTNPFECLLQDDIDHDDNDRTNHTTGNKNHSNKEIFTFRPPTQLAPMKEPTHVDVQPPVATTTTPSPLTTNTESSLTFRPPTFHFTMKSTTTSSSTVLPNDDQNPKDTTGNSNQYIDPDL